MPHALLYPLAIVGLACIVGFVVLLVVVVLHDVRHKAAGKHSRRARPADDGPTESDEDLATNVVPIQ